MNVAVATIGALLLLLPGVGFVTGVNLADKNVREIVFRNTPAEIGYVIVVSLVVHLAFAWLPFNFNAGYEVLRYNDLQASKPTPDDARLFLVGSNPALWVGVCKKAQRKFFVGLVTLAR
jgi:hypothetical protein